MLSLLEHFWNEHKDVNEPLKENLFGGISQDILSCCCGNRQELPVQHMSELIPIQIIGQSVQNGLDNIFKTEQIPWECPKCSSGTAERRMSILQKPQTLILQQMRYSFDFALQLVTKNPIPIVSTKCIVLPSGTTYSLQSVINHIGDDTKSGHYNIIIRDQTNENVLLLDDSDISTLDKSDVVDDVSYILCYIKDRNIHNN